MYTEESRISEVPVYVNNYGKEAHSPRQPYQLGSRAAGQVSQS